MRRATIDSRCATSRTARWRSTLGYPRRIPIVTVLDSSSNPLCTVTLPGTTCAFTPSAAGTVNLLAQYDGDANYAITLSSTLPLDVAAAPVPPAAPTPVPTLGMEALVLLVLAVGALAGLGARRG